MTHISNITNPGAQPVEGDILEHTYENGVVVKKQFNNPFVHEETPESARSWRDGELMKTDWIVPVSDHPQRAAYMTYRTALRNWPTTGDFPATKPVIG